MPSNIYASIGGINLIDHSKPVEEGSGCIDIANAKKFYAALAYTEYVEDKARESFTNTQCLTCACSQEEHAY